jgi:hypothetical protein
MKNVLRVIVFLWFLYYVNAFVQTQGIGINPLGFVIFLLFAVVAVL